MGVEGCKIMEKASVQVPPSRCFSNDWLKVGESSLGGYGVFALKDIDPRTSILLEQPFLSLKDYNTLRQKYANLSLEEKVVFDGLHAYAKSQPDVLAKDQREQVCTFCYPIYFFMSLTFVKLHVWRW